ncbi:MAG: hypothetical protein ACPL3P_01870, partial [Anaerolineales bacterium]
DPKRPDLQVLLARAYYEVHQENEAAEVASQLVATLPYCFDANLVLYHIAIKNNKTKEAQLYWNKLVELDPYAEFISADVFSPELVPDSAVMVEKLAAPLEQELGEATQPPAWITAEMPNEETQPPSVEEDQMNIFPTEESVPESPPRSEDAEKPSEIPEWLRDAGWDKASAETEEAAHAQTVPPFPEEELDIEPGEIPDWLKELAPETEAPETTLDNKDIESLLTESPISAVNEKPEDWINELAEKQIGTIIEPDATRIDENEILKEMDFSDLTIAENALQEETNNLPQWFTEDQVEKEESILEEPPISELDTKPVVIQFESSNIPLELSEDESPDWVKEYLESQIEKENIENIPTNNFLSESEPIGPEDTIIPEWLKETLAESTESPEEILPTEEAEPLNATDSLLSFEELSQSQTEPPLEELPDWLQDVKGIPIEEEIFEETSNEEEEITGVEATPTELPDWIKEQLPQEPISESLILSEEEAQEELPEWIKSEFGEAQAEQTAVGESEIEEELPDWIKTEFSESSQEEPLGEQIEISEEELPEWIKSEATEVISEELMIGSEESSLEEITEFENQNFSEIAQVEQVEELKPIEPTEAIEELIPVEEKQFEVSGEELSSLHDIRIALHNGQLESALAGYERLIKQKQELDAVISDLSSAVYQYPMEIRMWMLLGDAYLRKDLLAEALNAYNKAEELIR